MARIRDLSSRFDHSIEILRDYDPTNKQNYNCFGYALDLHITCHYSTLVTLSELGVLVDSQFINYLIQRDVLKEIPFDEIKIDDLVMYFSNSCPTHAGKWKTNKVLSKWGRGLLYRHNIYEVPMNYGEPKFFSKLPPQVAKQCFIQYAKERGIGADDLQDA
jgi:hypothetical protein